MRKACVISGSRAEYGLLKKLMDLLNQSDEFELQIIAAAMHLSPDYGETYKEIEKDGFQITHKAEMLLASDTETSTLKAMALGIIEFSSALERLKPDFLIILGDRFEVLAAAQTAMILKIPVVHIHGGESTQGAIDEAIRHSITKMSQIHFTACESYRRRVIQLGENPNRVFNTGAPGIDNIFQLNLMGRDALSKSLKMDLSSPFLLVTYHPVTLQAHGPQQALQGLFKALDQFKAHSVIFTMPNCDPSGREITKAIEDFVRLNSSRMRLFSSLGQLRYLSALKEAAAVVGNSSSGIIEAPALKTPTVNIGTRQLGRICDKSVVNSSDNSENIALSLTSVLSQDFQSNTKASGSLFGNGKASEKMFEILRNTDFTKILSKKFFDIQYEL